jgi:sugar phosphate isomerase/epimerase
MFDVAISQLTTPRWELAQELAYLTEHGFSALSLWRPKLSDSGPAAAARLMARCGVRCSSLQWAGGFTGSDGRSFKESVSDACEAIEMAGDVGAPVLLVHSGCRGGHTRSHAARLLGDALETLAPAARRAGVTLAVRPIHPLAAPGCSFLTCVVGTLSVIEQFGDPAVRMALDLWQFGHASELPGLLPRLAAAAAVVQVADRVGPPTAEADRLPAGHGGLPLESLVAGLWEHGFAGTFEFDPVGEAVEMLGYGGTLAETRRIVDSWEHRLPVAVPVRFREVGSAAYPACYRRPVAPAGSRRSQASSQAVSRG